MNNELLNNELLNNELLNNELLNNELLIREMDCTNHCVGSKRKVVDVTQGFKKSNIGTDNALMIRCRVTGNKDDDLIEVEVALPTIGVAKPGHTRASPIIAPASASYLDF